MDGYWLEAFDSGLDDQQLTLLATTSSRRLGVQIPQDSTGSLMTEMRAWAGNSTSVRDSATNRESRLHTDGPSFDRPPDYIGMLCLSPATTGGLSRIVSGIEACSLIDPDHLELLSAPDWPFDRRGGVRPGQDRVVLAPVVERTDGRAVRIRYLRSWIEKGYEACGWSISPDRARALDAFDAGLLVAASYAEFPLGRGQMLWLDNRTMLHGRSAFSDAPGNERRYLRFWSNQE